MKKLDQAFSGLTAPCCTPGDTCACGVTERVLRGYAYGKPELLPAMTVEQQTACLDEISSFEGNERSDWEGSTDAQLAGGVLSAWQDYCQGLGVF
ncbi:TPA: hypothetical protein ACNVX4_006304 [Pseudomonas aeruginosa]|nr:hypothetical protein [Pseudomonas aeruginosa]HCA5866811.1 hypothetical protein [Pseudomonas aeruginosa]HCA7379998.1 hypothetical protein [Pseudomonas aeruginosa]HCA7775047.1 hypothetical protein [Pseudomonas aeruginosa]